MIVYSDIDAHCCAWLGELVKAGELPPGEVWCRDIKEVTPDEVRNAHQFHAFCGIGGWPYALSLAGYDGPCWTASLPCQPFSSAGKRLAELDERHLWPVYRSLVTECRPATIFGEQVASKDGRAWLAGVFDDLEALGYRCGAADLCAASVGAPHIRQRLFWVADAKNDGLQRPQGARAGRPSIAHDGKSGWLGNAAGDGRNARGSESGGQQRAPAAGRMGDANDQGPQGRDGAELRERASELSAWSSGSWHLCQDNKHRRIAPEPEFFPLAHGVPARVGRLRGYGNAIVPQAAAEVLRAWQAVMR